jgi:2-oxo-3-hexenedioate decarboxylase
MRQVEVDEVIAGVLTDAMLVEEGGRFDLTRCIHPRVEPEIAFRIGRPMSGRISVVEAANAVEAVAPALEIIDSRYQNFKFRVADVVADNSSACGLVIGPWSSPHAVIANLGMVLAFDGRPVQVGSSAAILGHPLRALIAAAELAGQSGGGLEPGDVVLAGAATAAEALRPGVHVQLCVQTLGRVAFTAGDQR